MAFEILVNEQSPAHPVLPQEGDGVVIRRCAGIFVKAHDGKKLIARASGMATGKWQGRTGSMEVTEHLEFDNEEQAVNWVVNLHTLYLAAKALGAV